MKWEIRLFSFTGELHFPRTPWTPIGLEERMCGRRKRETTYGCNLKMLFLVTLKCGKSKSLSLGRLWEGKLEIWERGEV